MTIASWHRTDHRCIGWAGTHGASAGSRGRPRRRNRGVPRPRRRGRRSPPGRGPGRPLPAAESVLASTWGRLGVGRTTGGSSGRSGRPSESAGVKLSGCRHRRRDRRGRRGRDRDHDTHVGRPEDWTCRRPPGRPDECHRRAAGSRRPCPRSGGSSPPRPPRDPPAAAPFGDAVRLAQPAVATSRGCSGEVAMAAAPRALVPGRRTRQARGSGSRRARRPPPRCRPGLRVTLQQAHDDVVERPRDRGIDRTGGGGVIRSPFERRRGW